MKSLSVFKEIKTDINTLPVDFEKGGTVHKGFLDGLDEIWQGDNGLLHFLTHLHDNNPQLQLWTCGHSLGGALATLCFAQLEWAKGLYIYGAPKVGDEKFVALLKNRPAFRIEHGRDPVPMVPPDLPKLNLNFVAIGSLVYISHDGEISFKRPVVSAEKEVVKIKETLSVQNERRSSLAPESLKELLDPSKAKEFVADIGEHISQSKDEWLEYFDTLDKGVGLKIPDHMPIYYCIKLWNNLVANSKLKS